MFLSRLLAAESEETEHHDDYTDRCHEAGDTDDHHRFLAGGGPVSLDFTAFNVAIVTVLLILSVENVRHYIDSKFAKHIFVKRVLEVLYEELSTLGIVESIIFLVMKYNSSKGFIEKETVFAQFHFMLFYTTIFNAIQSCMVAYGSKRISKNLWVKSEAMDLDHYAAIRREFVILDKKFKSNDVEDIAEGFLSYGLRNWKRIFVKVVHFVRSPIQARNHNAMNVVVRFHEIRHRFIEENDLPPQFEVSRYLKNCERDIFLKLVHITNFAWVGLIAILNFCYFLMGVVASIGDENDQERNNANIGKVLSCLFIATCLFFVLLSYVLLHRTKWIFSKIFHENFFNKKKSSLGFGQTATQLELFFNGNPDHVTDSLQYMQFGFALMAGCLLIFWESVGVDISHAYSKEAHDGFSHLSIQSRWSLFWFLIISYFLFYQNAKNTIPRFTLCTNLGQLVNIKQLNATLSMYHFGEEQWKRKLVSEARNDPIAQSSKDDNVTEDESVKSKHSAIRKPTQMEQISSFVSLPIDALPSSSSVVSDTQLKRSRVPLRRSISESAAFFAPFPASTQAFRNSLLHDDSSVSSDSKVNHKSDKIKVTNEISSSPNSSQRQGRKKSYSAPLNSDEQSMFNVNGAALATLHEQIPDSPLISPKPSLNTRNVKTSEISSRPIDTPPTTKNENDSSLHSDFEDVPTAHTMFSHDKQSSISFTEYFRLLYTMNLYNTIDTVFGTLFCFYLIGMRMEILLVDSCKIFLSTNSAEFRIDIAFWFEFSLFVYFIASSLFFIAIHTTNGDSIRYVETIVAESFNVLLSILCVSLLLISEYIRCPNNTSCDNFGSRSGLGIIEPFTALIIFRLFRHMFGRFVNRRLIQRNSRDRRIVRSASNTNLKIIVDSEAHHHQSKGESMRAVQNEWTKTIQANPDLVKDYGMFSSEILHAMLGLEILSEKESGKSKEEKTLLRNENSYYPISKNLKAQNVTESSLIPEEDYQTHGKPILSLEVPKERAQSFISVYDSDSDESASAGFDTNRKLKVTNDNFQKEKGNHLSFVINAPDSRLIRSMRRCAQKMPPMVNCWELVDIAITQHEILFFAVDDNNSSTNYSKKMNLKVQGIRAEMTAKHGGKGLRLSDVALGRKIVGHTNISRIKSIKVGFRLPTDQSLPNYQKESTSADNTVLGEYWAKSNDSLQDSTTVEDRFNHNGVNNLKIQSSYGQTIYLRFLCDLALAEKSDTPYTQKRVTKGDLNKMMPLLWCHTLVRLRSTDLLEQDLPHFGLDNDDELNDYIEEEGINNTLQVRKKKLLRRFSASFGETEVHESIP